MNSKSNYLTTEEPLTMNLNRYNIPCMIQFEGKTPRRPRFDRVEIEAALRERPGEWATIDEGPSNVMGAYASKWRGTSGRRFEWAVSSLEIGRAHV